MAKIIIIFSMTALLLAGGCGSPGPENILLEESMQNDGECFQGKSVSREESV